jgi:stearoyl-CoA desaturase (delta-9 desaturase)
MNSNVLNTNQPLADAQEALSQAGVAVGAAIDDARDKVGHAVDQAKEKVSQTFEQARESFDHAKERVQQVAAHAKESLDHAKERVQQAVGHAKERVVHAVEGAKNSVEHVVDGVSHNAGAVVDKTRSAWRRGITAIVNWLDTRRVMDASDPRFARIAWLRVMPFLGVHVMCLGVFFVGVSAAALWTALALYLIRMFAITGFYHRYFSHKSFKTSRVMQFLMGVLGASAVQRGPLWWAAHHRNHHRNSDQPEDFHSPKQHGFWWAHMGWFMTPKGFITDHDKIPDLMKFPELRLLDRFDTLIAVALATGLYFFGEWLGAAYGTSGMQMLIWGFFVSTVVLFHGTVTINSLSHVWGTRRYQTKDDSRNNWFLAIITLGEGWHNNHHHFPGSARQGFYWWEYDMTYYGLKVMSWCGLVWDLKPVPEFLKDRNRV